MNINKKKKESFGKKVLNELDLIKAANNRNLKSLVIELESLKSIIQGILKYLSMIDTQFAMLFEEAMNRVHNEREAATKDNKEEQKKIIQLFDDESK